MDFTGLEEKKKELYDAVCTALNVKNGDIWYYSGIKAYTIYYDKEVEDFSLKESSFNKDIIMAILGGNKSNYKDLLSWLASNKAFKSKPYLVKRACLTTEVKNSKGFKFSNGFTEDNWKERSQTEQLDVCLESGRFTLNVAMCKVEEENNEAINDLLEIVIPHQEERDTFKDMLALYAFENRGGMAKPTFVMYGKRGTGKNLLVEGLIGNIFPGQVAPMPPNAESFTGYLEKKGTILDENTVSAVNQEKQYQHIKKMSGAKLVPINRKGVDSYDAISHTWYFILANEKPLHIRDEIQAPHNNQFFVLYADTDKSDKFDDYIKKYREYATGGQSSSVVKTFLGHYIQTELFEIYCKLKKRMVVKGSRYGMSVIPTRGLKMIKGMSSNVKEGLVDQLLSDLYRDNIEDYDLSSTLQMELKELKARGFLSFKVLTQVAKAYGLKSDHIKHILEQKQILKTGNTRIKMKTGIREKNVSGMKLDLEKMEDFVTKEVMEC